MASQTLWQKITTNGDKAFDAGKLVIAQQLLQSNFVGNHTSAQSQILNYQASKQAMLDRLASDPMGQAQSFNVNDYININVQIEKLGRAMAACEAAYVEFFGPDGAPTRAALEAAAEEAKAG